MVAREVVASAANALTSPPAAEARPVPDEQDHADRGSSRLIASVAASRSLRQAVVDAVGGVGAVQREVGDPVAHLEQHVSSGSHGTGCYERPSRCRTGASRRESGQLRGRASPSARGHSVRAEGACPTARACRAAEAAPGAVGVAPAGQHATPRAKPVPGQLRLGKEPGRSDGLLRLNASSTSWLAARRAGHAPAR